MKRAILKKVMFVGRATTFCVGLAVILALSVGLASAALAGTGVGARFDLGNTNAVDAITKLVGNVAGPSLQIDNNSTGTGATALDLQTEAGKPPMKVNSDTKVANLNADKLDGLSATDLQGLRDLRIRSIEVNTSANTNGEGFATCVPGERATGGGVELASGTASKVFYFEPGGRPKNLVTSTGIQSGWESSWFAKDVAAKVRIYVVCAS